MITTQVESFERAIPELRLLFPIHWKELALFQDRMPLSPQWSTYIERERDGIMFLATVRQAGALIAYYTTQVAPGLHYSETMTATMDILYIHPHVRNRGLALPLFKCVEKELRRRGVKIWYSGYKTNNALGLDKLLDLFGFTPADSYCVKWLD